MGNENLAHDIRSRWSNLLPFLQSRRTLDTLEDDLKSGLADVLPIGRCALPISTLSSVIARARRSTRPILRPSTTTGSHEDTSLRSRMGSDSPLRQHRSWALRWKRSLQGFMFSADLREGPSRKPYGYFDVGSGSLRDLIELAASRAKRTYQTLMPDCRKSRRARRDRSAEAGGT